MYVCGYSLTVCPCVDDCVEVILIHLRRLESSSFKQKQLYYSRTTAVRLIDDTTFEQACLYLCVQLCMWGELASCRMCESKDA